MRKQFNLQDWLKDKSQKVETRDGHPVKLLPINSHNARPIIGEFEMNGKTVYISTDENGSWTEGNGENQFDLFIVTSEPELSEFEDALKDCVNMRMPENPMTDEGARNNATILRAIAFKEFKENEASHMKELVEQKEKEVYERGKAEAMKNLPRWTKHFKIGTNEFALEFHDDMLRNRYGLIIYNGYEIRLSDLLKLPGFKED